MNLLHHPLFFHYYQWLLSFITVTAMALASEKNKATWTLSLTNQLLWLIYIVLSEQYGLIFMNLGMWYFCFRGYFIWNHNQNRWLNAIFVKPRESIVSLFNRKKHVS